MPLNRFSLVKARKAAEKTFVCSFSGKNLKSWPRCAVGLIAPFERSGYRTIDQIGKENYRGADALPLCPASRPIPYYSIKLEYNYLNEF